MIFIFFPYQDFFDYWNELIDSKRNKFIQRFRFQFISKLTQIIQCLVHVIQTGRRMWKLVLNAIFITVIFFNCGRVSRFGAHSRVEQQIVLTFRLSPFQALSPFIRITPQKSCPHFHQVLGLSRFIEKMWTSFFKSDSDKGTSTTKILLRWHFIERFKLLRSDFFYQKREYC